MKLHASIKDGFLYSASVVSLGVITVIRKKSQIIISKLASQCQSWGIYKLVPPEL